MRGMTDEAKSPPPDAPAAESSPKKAIEGPKLAYVKGGQGTGASERLYEQRFQEAEKRRDKAELERLAARDQKQVTLPDGKTALLPGEDQGAVMYTSQMTAHPEVPKAYVLLKYLTRSGEPASVNGEAVECLADIIVGANPENPTELCLVIVCPRCSQDSHKHQQDNQLRIFQSNKFFELTPGVGPAIVAFQGQSYRSAGIIRESERFDCPDCGWRARITNNCVRPD